MPERRGFAGTIGRRASKGGQQSRFGTVGRSGREAAIAWEQTNRDWDRKAFEEQIRPHLVDVPIQAMVAATGLSASYCARIRNGPVTPHPRHWSVLRGVVDSNSDRPEDQ
jgi:hypothetical protein